MSHQRIDSRPAIAQIVAAMLFGLVTPSAQAAPCAGFQDVDSLSVFCVNVEWQKNRAVTLGCSASAYCPNDPVNRLAMAAFLNRLGTALTPVQLNVDASPGALDLDSGGVTCQTGAFVATGFPRRAIVDTTFSGTAASEVAFSANAVFSTDNGANWNNLGSNLHRDSIPANRWGHPADVGHLEVYVGQTVRFGIRAHRDGQSGTADLLDSRCQIRVLVFSRDGPTSPY